MANGTPVVTLDKERAAFVFRAIADAWERREKDFSKHEPPERKHMPESIEYASRDHALWIFASGHWSRSGQTADQAIGHVGYFARNHPYLLDPLAELTEDQEAEFETVMKPRFPFHEREKTIRLKNWRRTLEILREKYDGDPRNIFYSIDLEGNIRKQIRKRLEECPGVAHKIAQLIIQWFQEVRWEEERYFWTRFANIQVSAIDIWLMRLIYQFGLVLEYTTTNRDTISLPISDQIVEICKENGIDHRPLIQALWHIGARICHWARMKPLDKLSVWCFHHCPGDPFCRCIVPANQETQNRGDLLWEKAYNRRTPGILPLFDEL